MAGPPLQARGVGAAPSVVHIAQRSVSNHREAPRLQVAVRLMPHLLDWAGHGLDTLDCRIEPYLIKAARCAHRGRRQRLASAFERPGPARAGQTPSGTI